MIYQNKYKKFKNNKMLFTCLIVTLSFMSLQTVKFTVVLELRLSR